MTLLCAQDEASAFYELFFSDQVYNEIIMMTYKELENPREFKM